MTQQINFPQSPIVDDQRNLSLEWREWLLNPQTLTAKFSIALGVSSGGTGSSAVPTNGQILIGNGTSYATASLGAGTGLTVTPGAGTLSVGITNTAVTAGTYGSAAKSVTYTVNAQGQLTSSAEQSIAIDTSQLASGYLAAARFPALTGDVTTIAGALGTTLATVNANVGSFGSASKSISITVNGKGLVTAASESSIAITNTQVSGLGTMSTQNANSVAITGGTITGTTVSGMTVSATAGTTMTFPTTNATIARTDAAQTFTGTQTFSSTIAGSINGNAATVTTNANLTGPITSVGNATSVASQTGTGSKFVMDTNPSFPGNITFSGNGNRFTGNFSDATIANRALVQSSTTNGNTLVGAIPNGTAVATSFQAFNNSTPASATGQFQFTALSTECQINANSPAGSYLPLTVHTGGAESMRVDTLHNIYGTSGTTTMTDGFFYIPSAAGAPTGVTTAIAGHVPMYYDSTNNDFYVYNGGWKKVHLA